MGSCAEWFGKDFVFPLLAKTFKYFCFIEIEKCLGHNQYLFNTFQTGQITPANHHGWNFMIIIEIDSSSNTHRTGAAL